MATGFDGGGIGLSRMWNLLDIYFELDGVFAV